MDLQTPLKSLTGIGSSLSYKLSRLNILTIKDLIYHFPFRYDDFSQNTTVKDAQIGQVVTFNLFHSFESTSTTLSIPQIVDSKSIEEVEDLPG